MLRLRISFLLPVVLLLAFPVLWQPVWAHWLVNEGALCVLHSATVQQTSQGSDCSFILKSALAEESTLRSAVRLVALLALESEDDLQPLALLRSYKSAWQGDPITSYRALLAERLYADQPQDLGRWRDTGLSQYFFDEAGRLRSRGRYDQAMAATELAYLLDNSWRDEWSRALNAWIIGKAYHQAGHVEAAKQALQTALPGLIHAEKRSGREYAAYAYRRLGEIAEQQGDNDAAFEYYVQSILISPQHADFFKLSDFMRRQGRNLDDIFTVLAELRRRGQQDDPYP